MTTDPSSTLPPEAPRPGPVPALERALAFRVAALLATYPDEEVVARLRAALPGLADADAALPRLPASAIRLAEDGAFADAARSEFIDVFDRSRQRNPLYASEYGIGIGKGNELADVAGFYRAFGLDLGQAAPDMPDGLAVELEFYGVLLLKRAALEDTGDAEGLAVVDEARRKFLQDHLGRLAPAVAARPDVVASAELGEGLAYARALVALECERTGIVPDPLVMRSERPLKDELTCDTGPGRHLPVVST